MLNEFGIAIRKVRLDRQLLLKNMADDLGVTSAFLSSVETGKRRVPNGWVEKIAELYALSEEERDNLQQASNMSVQNLKIPVAQATTKQKELAFSFAKALDGLTDEDVERIMNAINATKRGGSKRATKHRH